MIVERLFWLSLVWSPPCVGENNKQTKRGESARGSIKQYFIFLLLMIRWREGKRQGTFAYLIFFTFILCWCGLMRLCVSLWIGRPFRRTWRAPCWARAEPIHTDGRAADAADARVERLSFKPQTVGWTKIGPSRPSKSQTVSNLCTTHYDIVFAFCLFYAQYAHRALYGILNTRKNTKNKHTFVLCLSVSEVTSHILFNRKTKRKRRQGPKCGLNC